MQLNDLQILEMLKEGDSLAYNQLFDKYYMPLCVYSLKYCDSFELAEDIVQDLFVKIWDEKLYLKLDNAISPYLFKSVKNNTLQAIKKELKYDFDDIENVVNTILEVKLKKYEKIHCLFEDSFIYLQSIAFYNM